MATFDLSGNFGAAYNASDTISLAVNTGTISPTSTTKGALLTGIVVTCNEGAVITAEITSGTCDGETQTITATSGATPTPTATGTPTATPTATPTPTPAFITYRGTICSGPDAGGTRFFNTQLTYSIGNSVYMNDGFSPVSSSFCVEIDAILSYQFAVTGVPVDNTAHANCTACEGVHPTPTPTATPTPTPTPATPTPTPTPSPTPTVYQYFYNSVSGYAGSAAACSGNASNAIYSIQPNVIAAVAVGNQLFRNSDLTDPLDQGAGSNKYWGIGDTSGDLPLYFVEYGPGDNAIQGSGVCGTFYDFNGKVVNSSWDPSDGGAATSTIACGYSQLRPMRLLKRGGNTGAFIETGDRVYAAGATTTMFISSGFYSYNDGTNNYYWTSTDAFGTVGIDETLC